MRLDEAIAVNYDGAPVLRVMCNGAQIWPAESGGATAPSIVGFKKMENGNAKPFSIDVPDGTEAGHLMVLTLFTHSGVDVTITPPVGFAPMDAPITDWVPTGTAHAIVARYAKVATGSYSAGAHFSGSFSQYNGGSVGVLVTIAGATATENAEDYTSNGTFRGGSGSPSTLPITIPSITPTAANCLDLAIVAALNQNEYSDETDSISYGSGLSKLVTATHGDLVLSVAQQTLVDAVPTGDLDAAIEHEFPYRKSMTLAINVAIEPSGA